MAEPLAGLHQSLAHRKAFSQRQRLPGLDETPPTAHATAYERAQLLKRLLPGATESIETLLREHQSEMFTPRGGNETIARRAAWNILYKTAQRRLEIAILGYNYAEEQETPPHPL